MQRIHPSSPRHPYHVVIIGIVSALLITFSASAQSASPTPTPDIPPATLCTVVTPTFDDLNAMIVNPDLGGSPVAIRTPGIVPDGNPADPNTAASITVTIRELVACFNAGEPLRSFGLYTAPYLSQLFARQGGFSQTVYDSYATPEPTSDPSTHTAILAIDDIRLLTDGSAGANITLRYASIPMPKRFYVSFEWTGQRWLISGILGEISFSVP